MIDLVIEKSGAINYSRCACRVSLAGGGRSAVWMVSWVVLAVEGGWVSGGSDTPVG